MSEVERERRREGGGEGGRVRRRDQGAFGCVRACVWGLEVEGGKGEWRSSRAVTRP